MDGTLLNSKHEVSDRFFEIFEALQKKGIQFVAASGRQYHSMVDKLEPIKDSIIFIAENGALTKQNDKVLLTTPIDKPHVLEVLKSIRTVTNAHPVLCSQDNAYVDGTSDGFLQMLREYYTDFEIVADQRQVSHEVLKVAVYHSESSERHIYPVVQYLEENLKVKVSGAHWLDVSHINAHKGYALERVMQQQNIKPNEVLVFGDYNNDIEMLQLAHYSFAMANAHPDVKAVAKYQTMGNDDFGVETILERLL